MLDNPSDVRRARELWNNWDTFIIKLMEMQIKKYEEDMSVGETEWDAAKSHIEYLAKKQALIDFKNIFSL